MSGTEEKGQTKDMNLPRALHLRSAGRLPCIREVHGARPAFEERGAPALRWAADGHALGSRPCVEFTSLR